MKVERLVVDTNVWIAALISPDGTARELVRAILDPDIDVLFTESTFNELVSRLAKPKFDRYRDAAAWDAFLAALVERALWHEDSGGADGASADPDDDKFLALAVTGEADAIVSGDRDLLTLGAYESIPVLTPAQLLARLPA
jgi:putative PIN family toxin of toxin-antitoxin system